MTLDEILNELGIGEKEGRLYLAALEFGAASAADLAKKAGVQRTHFYDLGEKLLAAGLLKQIVRGKKKLFVAVDPEALVEMEQKKLERLEKALPELKALYSSAGQKPKISFYEGASGIEQINEDTLRYKGELLGFTTPRFVSSQSKSAGNAYIQKRIALGNRARVIGENAPEVRGLQSRDAKELRETRILSTDEFRSNVEIGIYGNKLFIIDYKEQFGFIIEGTEIVATLRMIFELVWNKWNR